MKIEQYLVFITFTFLLVNIAMANGGGDFSGSNNHSNQTNPNNDAYSQSRGYRGRSSNEEPNTYDNNRAKHVNPTTDAYSQSRGYTGRAAIDEPRCCRRSKSAH